MKLTRRGKTPPRWHWGEFFFFFLKEFAVIRQKKGNASGSWQDRLKTVGAAGLNLPYYSSPRASAGVCSTINVSPRGAETHRHCQFSQNVSSASNWASIRRQTDSPFVRQTGAMLTQRRKERRESQFTVYSKQRCQFIRHTWLHIVIRRLEAVFCHVNNRFVFCKFLAFYSEQLRASLPIFTD